MTIAILIALASLNRVTGFLLVLVFGLWHYDKLRAYDKRTWARFIAYGAIFVIITLGLRLIRGDAPHEFGIAGTFQINMDSLRLVILHNAVLLPLWLLFFIKWQRADPLLKRLSFMIIPYMLLILVFAQWHETRLQLVLFPVLLPIAFSNNRKP